MEELKRWRDERAARRVEMILGRPRVVPREAGPESTTPFLRRSAPATTRKAIAPARRARPDAVRRGGFRLWPQPPPVSPVHPEWDDPTGERFKKGIYRSAAGHLVLLPLCFLAAAGLSLDLKLPGSRESARPMRVFMQMNPSGSGGRMPALRQARTTPPKVEAPKKENPARARSAVVEPKAAEARPKGRPPREVASTVDTKTSTPVPVAVAAPKKKTAAPAPTMPRGNAEPAPSNAEPAVTDPVAVPGPLFAGVGPVAGSTASIGGVDGVYFPYNYYFEQIQTRIARAWQVPEGTVSPGRRIQAVVRFRILTDGTISEVSVEEPSGSSLYDQSALRAVNLVGKFGPLPQGFAGEFLVVHFQFGFVGH